MNAEIRRWHRAVWSVLALGAPAALSLAALTRAEIGPMAHLPAPLSDGTSRHGGAAHWGVPYPKGSGSQRGRAVQFEAVAVVDHAEPSAVVVRLAAPVRHPMVLVYRSSEPSTPDSLPVDATLLGPLTEDAIQAFPPVAAGSHIVLYSLADARVVGTAPIGGG